VRLPSASLLSGSSPKTVLLARLVAILRHAVAFQFGALTQ
jgi:hypothetical protein